MTLSRRQFLALPLAFLLAPRAARARPARAATYHAEIDILFGLFTLALDGLVDEEIDRTADRYRVVVVGEGDRVAHRIESAGLVRGGRLSPLVTSLSSRVLGRESRTQIRYDYDRGLAHYHHASETFFLRRRRVAEDVVRIPAGQPLDDVVTAALNHAAGLLEADGPGIYRTFVVRRARPPKEGPDDVQPGGYRAEIAPFRFTVTQDQESGRPVGLVDLTRFSSWASASKPARITFGPNRRPEAIHASLMFGTSFGITFQYGAVPGPRGRPDPRPVESRDRLSFLPEANRVQSPRWPRRRRGASS